LNAEAPLSDPSDQILWAALQGTSRGRPALATLVASQKRPPDSFDPKAGEHHQFPQQQTRLAELQAIPDTSASLLTRNQRSQSITDKYAAKKWDQD
jgi:hypothetical protein